jgi:hypothetical protein
MMKKAEQDHDPEALAFVAFRHPRSKEGARLADEAVRLHPNLVWIYGIVAVRGPSLPEIDRWVPALERFDPQNAIPHLITAEKLTSIKSCGKSSLIVPKTNLPPGKAPFPQPSNPRSSTTTQVGARRSIAEFSFAITSATRS